MYKKKTHSFLSLINTKIVENDVLFKIIADKNRFL